MAGDGPISGNVDTFSDDEWEFEYDYDSTESFFVILEFALDTSVYPPGGRHQASDRWGAKQKANQESSTPQNAQNVVAPASEASSAEEDAGVEQDASTKAEAHEKLQVLDLASANPLISRNGRAFSATWGRTIGTNLVLSAPGAVEEDIEPVLRTEGFDLVSLSRLKLVANPVTLQPKTAGNDGLIPSNKHTNQRLGIGSDVRSGSTSEQQTLDNGKAPVAGDIPAGQSPAIDIMPQKSRQRQFLDKFAELRKRKGQHKPILIRSGRNTLEYVGDPTGLRQGSFTNTLPNHPSQEFSSRTGMVQASSSMQAPSQISDSRGKNPVLPIQDALSGRERATTLMPGQGDEEGEGSADKSQDVTMTDDHNTTT